MDAVRAVTGLAGPALRLWARSLVPLLVCLLAGYLAFEALFAVSWRLGARDERLGLPVLAMAQLAELAAWVAMFLVVRKHLSVERPRPIEALTLTIGPFLGFYALWGLLDPLIADHVLLAVNNEVRGGDEVTRVGAASWQLYLPVAAGAWLLKSFLNRLGRPALAGVIAVLDAIWLFLTFWAITKGVQAAGGWFTGRAVWHWLTDAVDWLGRFELPFDLTIPEILSTVWGWWTGVVWPGLKEAVGQPLVWLAITALIYRQGRAPGQTVERGIGKLRRDRRFLVDLLTRDYRDKYLPLVSAIRQVLHLGLGFLAAFCLLYVATQALADWAYVGAVAVLDKTMEFPGFLEGTLDLGHQVLVRPLQVCLLAVAYDRVVTASARAPRAVPSGSSPGAEDLSRPSEPAPQPRS